MRLLQKAAILFAAVAGNTDAEEGVQVESIVVAPSQSGRRLSGGQTQDASAVLVGNADEACRATGGTGLYMFIWPSRVELRHREGARRVRRQAFVKNARL